MLRSLGTVAKQRKNMRKMVAKIALRSSYYIWSSRFNKDFLAPSLVPLIPQPITHTTPKPIQKTPEALTPSKTPVKQYPAQSPTPTSTTKLRKIISQLTPVDTKKWSDFNNWSPKSKGWFKDNIPLYELDCLMGVDPFRHSLQEFCGLPVETIYTKAHHPTLSTTSSHSLGSINTATNTLADTFQAISRAPITAQQLPMSEKNILVSSIKQLCTNSTTTPTTPDLKTPVKHLNYSTMNFGTPPELGGFEEPCIDEPLCLDNWDF